MRQDDNQHIIGKCPACGLGNIIETAKGFYCDNERLPGGGKCGFGIFRMMHGVEMSASLVSQLITEGRTGEMRMVNYNGQPFQASFALLGGRVDVLMKCHTLKGRCPVCGGRVVKTSKGYSCEFHIGKNHLCDFHVTGVIHGRKIHDEEMEALLEGNAEVLDGFTTLDGKVFSSVLCVRDNGEVGLEPRITTCPSCGGSILVSPLAYNCSNFKTPGIFCKFFIWRNIAGHEITAEEMRQVCEEGKTREPLKLFRANGSISYHYLSLNEDKSKIIKIEAFTK